MKELIEKGDSNNSGEENLITNHEDNEQLIPKIPESVLNSYKEIQVKDSVYYKNKLKNFFTSAPSGFIYAYILYILALEKCYEGEDKCSLKVFWIAIKATEELISCVIMAVMLQFMIFNRMSKFHFIHIVLFFVITYSYSNGLDFDDHGHITFIYYLFLLIHFTIIIFCVIITIHCYKNIVKDKILCLLYLLIIFVFIGILYFYFIIIKSNCDEWPLGLNNTSIDNDKTKYACQIQIPNQCTYKILQNVQDFTKISGKTCENANSKYAKKKLLSYSKSPFLDSKANIIGYPLMNKDPLCLLDCELEHSIFRKYFYDNLVDMENKEILEKHFKDKMPEVVVDFSNNNIGKMNINLRFNKTLSDERKLLEKNSEPYSNNVIYLYIDSLSRNNGLRQLKKTMDFFKKFISYKGGYNEQFPSHNFHSFEFFKYYCFEGYTSINFPIMHFGRQKESNEKTSLIKYYKNSGFITSNCYDLCDKAPTRSYHNYTYDEMYDHLFSLCDINNEHMSSARIRCLYGKQTIEHLTEYTDQFWRKYSDNRKYASIMTNHAHEATMNILKYTDDVIFNFLNNLFNDNLLKDTSIIMLSDHGLQLPSIYFFYDFYRTEKQLPILAMIINDRKGVSYEEQYEHMRENQQTFLTGFDIYNTLVNIVFGDKYNVMKANEGEQQEAYISKNGISLFDKINPMTRSPKVYNEISPMDGFSCK